MYPLPEIGLLLPFSIFLTMFQLLFLYYFWFVFDIFCFCKISSSSWWCCCSYAAITFALSVIIVVAYAWLIVAITFFDPLDDVDVAVNIVIVILVRLIDFRALNPIVAKNSNNNSSTNRNNGCKINRYN